MAEQPRKTRFLIQHDQTGLFLKLPGDWVAQRSDATDYDTLLQAVDASRDFGPEHVHVFMDFGQTSWAMPTPDAHFHIHHSAR